MIICKIATREGGALVKVLAALVMVAASATLRADIYVTSTGAGATFGTPIYTVDDWTNLLSCVSEPSGNYVLMNDLDFTGLFESNGWQSAQVGSFKGKLFGQGHSISNLCTTWGDYSSTVALFDSVSAGAEIRDLTVVSSNVTNDQNTLSLAGLAVSVGSGVTISNCHAVVDWQGVYPAKYENNGNNSCMYYGLARTVRGSDIHIVDCTVEGRLAGGTEACGFVGEATINGGEIARCAVVAEVSAITNRAGGAACGFAQLISLDGGSTIRECFSAGVVDAAASACGFANAINFRDTASSMRDSYSVSEVKAGKPNYYAYGIAKSISGYNSGSPNLVTNVWFGGTVRDGYRNYAFAGDSHSVTLANCKESGPRSFADWAGYDFDNVWSMTDGSTTPYFAWSLADGKFRLFAAPEPGATITIDGGARGASALPGSNVTVSAVSTGGAFFCGWAGAATYTNANVNPSAMRADNHRTARAIWGKAITTRAELEAVASDLAGSYALGADIDISDGDWTPIGSSGSPFTGSLYAQGHKITGLRIAGTSDYAGLFRSVKDATLDGIRLEGVSVSGRQYTGALAGDVQGATTIRNCSAEGVVSNTSSYAGLLVGRVYGSGTTFNQCTATGTVVATSQDTGGLVGGVYYYPATFADCAADVLVPDTSGNNKGGFIGSVRDGSASATFARCAASGDLVATNNSANVGGFIGYANKPVSFEDCIAAGDVSGKGSTGGFAGKAESAVANYVCCSASGTVVSLSFAAVGGFIGSANGQNSRFEDCAALGPLVSSTSSQTGGFAGYVSASNDFVRCVAEGAVSGTSQTGGFVGQANGNCSQYLSCIANGSVTGAGNQTGGFVGLIGSTGLRFTQCSALGGVSAPAYTYVGGFVGQVNNSNDLWRCMCAGAATGKQYVGGFVGYQYGGNTAIRECFALGDATALNAGDAYAGGFAGDLYATAYLSDSYCLGTVKGQRYVGGFAGRNYNSATTITRCYAAGVVDCAGTYVGAFLGYAQSVPAFTDCAVMESCHLGGEVLHAIGTSTAGTAAPHDDIAEYDAAGMKSTVNFATWLALCGDGNVAVWSQQNGGTQPYLAWSAPSGKLSVYAFVDSSARGEIEGVGEYAPGTAAAVTAIPNDGFFVSWIGSTPYADPSAPMTTIVLDNHRVAAAQFGKLITTADELDAVRNDLGGIYGLGADIDLAGHDWTPIGDSSKKFTGKFYGFGHSVKNLVATNNPNSSYKGLFGYTDGAVLDGVTVSGTAKCNSGYNSVGGLVGRADATLISNCHATATVEGGRYVGGLVGGVNNGTSILGCSAAGTVKSTGNYADSGGFAGGCESGAFEIRDSISSAEVTAVASCVGGFIGHVAGSSASVISGCRADGYAGGNGSVGGFIGNVSAPMAISNCVARGDVRSSGVNYGGFVGYLDASSATISDCWCQGAVWGTGGTIGAFIGNKHAGTIRNCSIYAYGAGPRPFCGNPSSQTGGSLTASQIDELSADWPAVKRHVDGATPISTAEEFLAVTNNLSGIYVLKNDIDLGGAVISPIGQSTAFSGEFYGRKHKIKNFVIDSSEQYVGLFGQISGGRVSGVMAEGSVSSGWTGSEFYTGTGGFVGRLDTQSLVDGCSFEGVVTNRSSGIVGGFVGKVDSSPVILRSCVVGTVTLAASDKNYAGGFVGIHNGGYMMDCYAVVDVHAGNNAQVGGFAGCNYSGEITTSWCAGSVETMGNNKGAFAGSAQTNHVTKSYFDSGKTSLLAVNSAAYVGITPRPSAEMLHAANFDFDFDRTWLIDEGKTTPYLQAFIVVKRGYDVWLEQNGIPADTEPNDLVNGLPAGLRYVYNIPAEATSLNGLATPFFRIVTMSGKPRAAFLPTRDGSEDVRVNTQVFATTELSDMGDPDPAHWPHRVEYVYDTDNDVWKPATGLEYSKMFFRWRVTFERAEE